MLLLRSELLILAPGVTGAPHTSFQRQEHSLTPPSQLGYHFSGSESFCREEPELPTNDFIFSSQILAFGGICLGLYRK